MEDQEKTIQTQKSSKPGEKAQKLSTTTTKNQERQTGTNTILKIETCEGKALRGPVFQHSTNRANNHSHPYRTRHENSNWVICDICRSPDQDKPDKLLLCGGCDIGVHLSCYGITPGTSQLWSCETCDLGIKPPCELCPRERGALKKTTENKWAHISCALWIPETSIDKIESMGPITGINEIPPKRWDIVCNLCKSKMGACRPCSVKICKTAYHISCAFKHKLEMRAVIENKKRGLKVTLQSYCKKHSQGYKTKDKTKYERQTRWKGFTIEEVYQSKNLKRTTTEDALPRNLRDLEGLRKKPTTPDSGIESVLMGQTKDMRKTDTSLTGFDGINIRELLGDHTFLESLDFHPEGVLGNLLKSLGERSPMDKPETPR